MDSPVAKRIGRQIKKARWEADMTQEQAAAALRVNKVTFSRWCGTTGEFTGDGPWWMWAVWGQEGL